jgi:endonuclease/exonuclease/phosphatase (EEP) superfamily protein YafD
MASKYAELRAALVGTLRRALVVCAIAYPLALLVVWALFYFWGERWWVTAAAMFAPRVLLALPLPFLLIGAWRLRLARLVVAQVLAGLIILFPLMGFVLPWPASKTPGPSLRLMTFNANSGYSGPDRLNAAVSAFAPDVVLFQEAPIWDAQLLGLLRTRYPHVQASAQFIIASRFPILETSDPPGVKYWGRTRSPRYLRYVLDSPLGVVAVYSIHPLSPRGMLGFRRFREILHGLRTGAALSGDAESDVLGNTWLRIKQLQQAARQAAADKYPVIVAGDTNMPALSAVLREEFSGFEDAFRASSWGFGYSYPQGHAFLRLDRIFLGRQLRAAGFDLGCQGVSDHYCAIADIQAR